MGWRVVATQQGHYNQCIMDVGMVFDLLLHDDGTYPPALKHTQKKDEKGNLIPDEWDSEPILGKDKKPLHRDFSEDMGNKAIKSGPKKGEVIRLGWMKRVPDNTPLGLYPVDESGTIHADFWNPRAQLPQAWDVGYHPWRPGPLDKKRNHAEILSVLPKEEMETA